MAVLVLAAEDHDRQLQRFANVTSRRRRCEVPDEKGRRIELFLLKTPQRGASPLSHEKLRLSGQLTWVHRYFDD